MHRLIQKSEAPQLHSIFLEVTSECNSRCLHCRGSFSKQNINEDIHSLDFKKIYNLLNEAKMLGASYLVITGGEPLMHPDLFDIIEASHKMDFNTILTTNGILLNRSIVQNLAKFSRLSIQISLESHRVEYHDFLRGMKGAFERAISACQLCDMFNIPFSTSLTLTKDNISDIDSFIKLSNKLGAKTVKLRRLIASGAGYQNYSLLGLKKEEIKKIVKKVIYSAQPCNNEKKLMIEQAPFGILFYEGRDALVTTKGLCTGCSAGIALCVISPDGKFRPCPSIPLPIADTNEYSLAEIWKNNPILSKLRNRNNLLGKCGNCKYRMICGGCRADSFCISGDIFAEDPLCWYNY